MESLRQSHKPILNEMEYELIGTIIMESLRHTLVIRVIHWQQGHYIKHTGIVASVDTATKYIILELMNGDITIPIDCIAFVERV
jgi:hypothetical protein